MRDAANISSSLANIEQMFLQLLLIIHVCRMAKTRRQSFLMKNRNMKLVYSRNISNKARKN